MTMMETVPVIDTFISGLGEVERLGGDCFRFTFFVEHQPSGGGEIERIIVAKLIAHACCVPEAIIKTLGAVGEKTMRLLPDLAELMH